MPNTIWEAWVPIAMDPDRPHLEDWLIKCWEEQKEELQTMMSQGLLYGELNPNFYIENGSNIRNLYRYLTVSFADAVFSVYEFDYSDKEHMRIRIKALPHAQIKIREAYEDHDKKSLIFVPRMLHRSKLITFDAYPSTVYPKWIHM